MTTKAFFLFPGQGAQSPGMAIDLLESSSAPAFADASAKKVKSLFSMASDIFGKDMADLLKNSSPETLKRTDISQPTITLANLAAAAYLGAMPNSGKMLEQAGCAGFSLGEYAALAVAGVISEEDCFKLVTERGKAMQVTSEKLAAAGAAPGMAAVMGLEPQKIEALIEEWKNSGINDLYAANFNSSRQTVISGTAEALTKAEKLFIEAGAKRCIRLQVAGPFHSPLMAESAEAFRPILEKVTFKDPVIPFYSNVSGKQVLTGDEAKKLALLQITSPVRWTSEEAAIAASAAIPGAVGIDCLLELGPGKVLQGLWKDTGSVLPCHSAGTLTDIEKFLTEKGIN